jgi:hypothetical protein
MANDRISQLPVETLYSPTSQKAQISQVPVETLYSPTSQKGRVSQLAVEVLVENIVLGSGLGFQVTIID